MPVSAESGQTGRVSHLCVLIICMRSVSLRLNGNPIAVIMLLVTECVALKCLDYSSGYRHIVPFIAGIGGAFITPNGHLMNSPLTVDDG